MGSSVLTVIACTPVLAAWLGVCVCRYRPARRRRRHHAEWAKLSFALADLDADLDRIWAQEQARIDRYW